ncbi:MAG: type II toxin-antitoxin system RelE/ParE family toxin [Nitrospirota bacterium]
MIENFKHKGLKLLYDKGDRSKLRSDIAQKAERFLTFLDAAHEVSELRLPGYGLHPLTGNLRGFWSVAVSRNHRIIFRFEDGSALDVDLVDYH